FADVSANNHTGQPFADCQTCVSNAAIVVTPKCSVGIFTSLIAPIMDEQQTECVCSLGLHTVWLAGCQASMFCDAKTTESITKQVVNKYNANCAKAPVSTPSSNITTTSTVTDTATVTAYPTANVTATATFTSTANVTTMITATPITN
ncbi:hypothetical protein BGZ97_009095, partial [Linnemannia gamsii]